MSSEEKFMKFVNGVILATKYILMCAAATAALMIAYTLPDMFVDKPVESETKSLTLDELGVTIEFSNKGSLDCKVDGNFFHCYLKEE